MTFSSDIERDEAFGLPSCSPTSAAPTGSRTRCARVRRWQTFGGSSTSLDQLEEAALARFNAQYGKAL